MLTTPQLYPRIEDEKSKEYGFLDNSRLKQHHIKISDDRLQELIKYAIKFAELKTRRVTLAIPDNVSDDELLAIYKKEGVEIFKYFKKYCGDPAASAYQINGAHYRDVCISQYRLRTLQKERMNSGWRYQSLAKDCALASRRFESVSDVGASEADFNASIKYNDKEGQIYLYVSVKNRVNTMGGQDWPKAIHALENVAKTDKNRNGPYCCVFGIAMDRGTRIIKKIQSTQQPHSHNTEVWKSDFFWPFFTNFNYEEIMSNFLAVLINDIDTSDIDINPLPPEEIVEVFGEKCQEQGLLNDHGIFNDPFKLVKFFVRK